MRQQHRNGARQVGIEVPVEYAHGAARLVQQDFWIQGQPGECRAEEPGREVQETAVRDPRYSHASARPSSAQPIVIHWFFSCSGIATVTKASAAPATSANRPRSLCPAGSSRGATATAPREPRLRRPGRRRSSSRDRRRRTRRGRRRKPSRWRRSPRSTDLCCPSAAGQRKWIGDEYGVERAHQPQQLRPGGSEIPTALPLENRQPRGRDRRNGNVRPAMLRRQPE